jgi:HEAT repeat protein/beta-lactamase regulating signal transducer with metallopeptidase domain
MSPLDLLQLLADTLGKGMVLLIAGLAAVRCLRRRSAAGRYAVWIAAFTGMLFLPAFSLVLPSLRPALPRTTEVMPRDVPPMAAKERATMMRGMSVRRAGGDMDIPAALDARDGIAWRRLARTAAPWLLGAWLAGALAVLIRLSRDVRRIARLTRRAALLRRGPLHELALDVAAELGLWQPVRVALSRELAVPVSWGLLRPIVLLPAASRRWDAERRRVVLRHEMAHIRRGDYAGHLLIELACAVHWLNPLAWRAARRARLEQEQACDDRVLSLGTGPVEYAQHLLDIARAFARPVTPARGALAMAAAATLPDRVRAILDVGLDHRPAGRRTVLAVAGAALCLGVPTAAVHPWSDGRRETELVALLGASDPVVRRDALWTLGARGAAGARPAITRRLRDDDPATRGVAAWALGKLGDRAAVEALTAALHDSDAHVREMAVLSLGELHDARAVKALEPLADDPEHGVRSVVTVALRQIRGEPAADALARLARSDPNAHTRVMATSALSKFDSRVRLAALEGALTDPEPDVRATAAWSLERLGGRASVPALIAALDRETDRDARDALIHALGASHDPRATQGLILALRDSMPELRESAAKMLGELGDERAVDPLIDATRDPDHEVRLTAVWALDALRRGR